MQTNLELSQELEGHEKAVRCVIILRNGTIATGGMDHLVCLWKPMIEGDKIKGYELDKRLQHHQHYVYCLADSCDLKKEYFYSGSEGKQIFKIDYNGNPLLQFIGHEGPISSLAERGEHLFSGSWDGTVRIWNAETTAIIQKFTAGVHAICMCLLPTGELATGSQDQLIKIWNPLQGTKIREIPGHNDIVRKIVWNNKSCTLISCSNDETIRQFSIDGLEMQQVKAHDSYIFDLLIDDQGTASNLNSTDSEEGDYSVYTCGDDRVLKIWNMKDMTINQSILHANTVWGVQVLSDSRLPNKTKLIVSACADGVVRLWTSEPTLFAEEKVREKQQADALENAAAASKQGAGIDLSAIPEEKDMARNPGKKNGEIKMFKNIELSIVNVYKWNQRTSLWDLIGEYAGGPDQGNMQGKKLYNGDDFFPPGEYDAIYDVEIGADRKAVIPYNRGDNILIVSEKFIARENIGKHNIEQITQFLNNATRGLGGNTSAPTTNSGGNTGGSGGAGGNNNKSTGGGPAGGTSKHFPVASCLYFDQGKVDAAAKKILEYNSSLPDPLPIDPEAEAAAAMDRVQKGLEEEIVLKKMMGQELVHWDDMLKKIGGPAYAKNNELRPIERELLWKRTLAFPDDQLFPVIDLWRLHLLHGDSADIFKGTDRGYSYLVFVMKHLVRTPESPLGVGCARFLCNVFNSFTNRVSIFEKRKVFCIEIRDKILKDRNFNSGIHKLVRLALGTLLLNFAVAMNERSEKKDAGEIFSCLKEYISCCSESIVPIDIDSNKEGLYRALAGVGTLALQEKSSSEFEECKNVIGKIPDDAFADDRIKQIKADLLKI